MLFPCNCLTGSTTRPESDDHAWPQDRENPAATGVNRSIVLHAGGWGGPGQPMATCRQRMANSHALTSGASPPAVLPARFQSPAPTPQASPRNAPAEAS
jgi:hypothetical protein